MFGDENDDQLDVNEQDSDRPSIGQLIAGIKQPSYMPRAAAPNTADVPAPEVRPQIDPKLIPNVGQMRQLTPEEIPTAGSNLPKLAQEQAALGTPLNRADPKYRPTVKGRIGGFLQGMAAGASGHPEKAPYVGPGATNIRFGRDEATRQANLANVNTQIGTQKVLDTENQKLRESALKQAYEGQLGEKATALGRAAEENAATRKELGALKAKQGPPNKTADTVAERTQVADQQGLKGEERKSYILTGKLPGEGREPRQPSELETWMQAFKRDNGRNPTADEIANRKANKPPSRADFDKVTRNKAKALKDAETAYNKAVSQLLPNDAEGRKQALDELNTAKDAAQQGYLDEIQTLNDRAPAGQARSNPRSTATPAAQQSPAKSAPKTPPKVGETILVDGKPHRVTGINPKTGKPQVVPIAGQ